MVYYYQSNLKLTPKRKNQKSQNSSDRSHKNFNSSYISNFSTDLSEDEHTQQKLHMNTNKIQLNNIQNIITPQKFVKPPLPPKCFNNFYKQSKQNLKIQCLLFSPQNEKVDQSLIQPNLKTSNFDKNSNSEFSITQSHFNSDDNRNLRNQINLYHISQEDSENSVNSQFNSTLKGQNTVTDLQKYKTEMCRNWQIYQYCNYGTKCRFAHGSDELQEKQNLNTYYKTRKCVLFFEQGFCNYGLRCHFQHGQECDRRQISYQQRLELGLGMPKRLSVFEDISKIQ